MLWLPLLYHPAHSSQFCMTAQGLSAMNGMQIKTGGKGSPSESRACGREGECAGGGSGGAVRCLWSRQWEMCRWKPRAGCSPRDTEGQENPFGTGMEGQRQCCPISQPLCAATGVCCGLTCCSLSPCRVKGPCRKAECCAGKGKEASLPLPSWQHFGGQGEDGSLSLILWWGTLFSLLCSSLLNFFPCHSSSVFR